MEARPGLMAKQSLMSRAPCNREWCAENFSGLLMACDCYQAASAVVMALGKHINTQCSSDDIQDAGAGVGDWGPWI